MRKFIVLFFLSFIQVTAFAQLSIPGVPASKQFQLKESIIPVSIHYQAPQKQILQKTSQSTEPQPMVAGYTIPLSNELLSKGMWQKAPSGTYVWRLALKLDQAQALNLYFKDFQLKTNDRLYIYNSSQTKILGAFSRLNNGPFFATSYLQGSEIVLELDSRQKYPTLPFKLELLGSIKDVRSTQVSGFGGAGSCEVPINCPEGASYQKQKKGVVRILLLSQGTMYWCTGSLINNTSNNAMPYLLTANHCGKDASTADYSQWIFYFNYESPDCSRPTSEPSSQSLSGATLIASSGPSSTSSTGSDFKLVLLKDTVPLSFHPYFNGWDVSGNISSQGVDIHHPEGDIKMISTYTSPIVQTDFGSTASNASGQYWKVTWAGTTSGHGVTEGGSSGSPLFNSNGLIIGALTGGSSACTSLDAPDYFGRLSDSWNNNNSVYSSQLKHWLDVNGTNVLQFPGLDPSSQAATPFFTANVQDVPVGGYVQFSNLSNGPITNYHWIFEGGSPSSSDAPSPSQVYYYQPGSYKVSLTVTSPSGQDSLVRDSYISVKPVIYPNPTTDGKFHILLGSFVQSDISISIYNMMGQKLDTFDPEFSNTGVTITLPHNQNGLYIIRVTNNGVTHTYKVMNFHQ